MSDLQLDLDISEILQLGKEFEFFEEELNRNVSLLAGQTHLHMLEQVQQRLHSRRAMYVKALCRPTEIEPGVYAITLNEEAVWIEEGLPAHSMVKDLLGDNPKVAKDGSRYRVIPFEHSKGGPTSQTPAEQELVTAIKGELKKLRIPWKGIERNPDDTPKSGTLHRFNIDGPVRPPGTEAGPGQNQHGYGHGSIGSPMVGPSGIPFLKGVTISQSPLFNTDGSPKLDSKGRHAASRSIKTFRVVSSKHEGSKWLYPGIEGTHFFEDALSWCEREWEQNILPSILKKLGTE